MSPSPPDTPDRPPEPRSRRPRSLPAWTLSTVLHVAVLLLAAWAIRPQTAAVVDEPDRTVSIVLASRSTDNTTEYFSRDETDPAAVDAATSAGQPTTAPAAPEAGDPFPADAAAESLLAEAHLPDLLDGLGPAAVDGSALAGLPAGPGPGRPRILPGQGDDEILANDPLRNRARVQSGPTTTIELFGHAGQGNTFAFLIDRSRSMGGEGLGAIAAAERELVRELARLTPEHRFQIIVYNQSYRPLNRAGLLAATDENKKRAEAFLSRTVAAGGTEHEPPLTAALRMRPDVIFLLTDGGPPPLTSAEIDLLTAENGGRSTIHCLHFGSGPLQNENNFLARLARRNGGGYRYIDMLRSKW